MKIISVLSLVSLLLCSAALRADEFSELSDSFGTTLTLAGTPESTTSNPDGSSINFWQSKFEGAPARKVPLSNPHMAMGDAYGNIYIADKASHSILQVTSSGFIHTFAGTHSAGFNGDGIAPATSLQISSPNGLFVLPGRVVYLLDPGNHRIRRVGRDGNMTTVVNDPDPRWYPSGRGLWISADETVIYYSNELAPNRAGDPTEGAVIKMWTASKGIETICSKSVGFRNPANMDVNPRDGKLYVTDRAEDDATGSAAGLFRIDGLDQRTRITGGSAQPDAADGQLARKSYIIEPRGITFCSDGSCFVCGHKDGDVWFIDTLGVLHKYLSGSPKNDDYTLPDGQHPPLVDNNYFSQPRSITLAPNGSLLVVCNDSGFVFRVNTARPTPPPSDIALSLIGFDVRLDWTALFKRGYRVERTAALTSDQWQDLGAVNGTSSGGATYQDPHSAKAEAMFYRILPAL